MSVSNVSGAAAPAPQSLPRQMRPEGAGAHHHRGDARAVSGGRQIGGFDTLLDASPETSADGALDSPTATSGRSRLARSPLDIAV
ncbi:MAG TPA: hypothetical protein VKY65_03745 [Alphaproteobacteria bacterium]|nr:hypothetical protein [Alphaproteobacteria bacterium]